MAGGPDSVWVPFLLICIFHAADSGLVFKTGNPKVDNILSGIPITLPNGTEFDHVNVKSVNIKLCAGMEEKLASMNAQLQQTTQRNSQLDEDASALRREVRQLALKLSTCSSAMTSIAGSYHAQLQSKMNHLLEAIDSEMFQVLKIVALTSDVRALRKKFESAVNSNGNSTERTGLLKELNTKTSELNAMKQKLNRSGESLELILEIISLQHQIWDLQQTELSGKDAVNVDSRRLALQEILDRKLSELQRQEATLSAVLEMISVRSQLRTITKRIKVLTERIEIETSHAERQLRQKIEQLRKLILLLSTRENDKNLTREILRLQGEVDTLSKLVSSKTTPTITAMEVELEVMRKEEIILQKKLENVDHTTAQLIMKIISIMEELREQQPTTGDQQLDILTLLHNYKQDYIKALTEIKNLKELLSQTHKPDLDLQQQYYMVKARLEQTIAELKKSGDSDTALVLTVLNLHDEIKALRERISTSTDTNEIARLQRVLREKEEELNSKTEDIERLIPDPQIILTIIELQNNIRELQRDTNATTGEMTALQQRLKGLLSELESKDQESTKQMMTILALQNEIKYLQTLLTNAEVSQSHTTAQLKNQLEAKQVELDKVLREMRERNQTNGNLLVTISLLQSQLRQLENKRETEGETTSATVSKLKEQLKIKEEESQEQQALIKTLQIALNQTEAQCSLDKQKIQELQNDLDTKLQKLNSTSNTVTSLALQVSTLTVQLEELKAQLENSVSSSKVEELQRTVEQKSAELDKKVEELRQKSAQAQRFLQIIALQVDIERQTIMASNETDYAKVRALQDHLNYLIEGIQDTDSENTKLTFQILAHQDELERLKRERESQLGAHVKKIKDLENELESVRAQIKEKTNLLGISTTRVANLSAQIMELREKIPPLQEEISDLKQTYEENYSELQERFNFTKTKLQNTEFQLKHADEKNFKLIMEISDLRAQLKKAKEQTSKASRKSIAGLEQQLRTQEAANRKLESRNRDLKQRVEELEMRCNANTDCEDLRRQLEQSQEDADRLHRQLQEKDAALKKLQSDFELKRQEKDKLQEDYDNVVRKLTDVEDRTIYNTKITWDPLTAHPRIALSADNTEVSTTEDVLQVQDNPGRFNVVLGVLGSSGFSRGRHYWEVSVAEKRCYHIGMASESAKRKGSIAFKPSKGFWTIILNKQGELKAIDRSPVTLRVERLPITLGILLDYNRGQVSFYDSGARSHLYSFSGQEFTDKIYPFLNYCVEDVENPQPITLLPPGSTDWIV